MCSFIIWYCDGYDSIYNNSSFSTRPTCITLFTIPIWSRDRTHRPKVLVVSNADLGGLDNGLLSCERHQYWDGVTAVSWSTNVSLQSVYEPFISALVVVSLELDITLTSQYQYFLVSSHGCEYSRYLNSCIFSWLWQQGGRRFASALQFSIYRHVLSYHIILLSSLARVVLLVVLWYLRMTFYTAIVELIEWIRTTLEWIYSCCRTQLLPCKRILLHCRHESLRVETISQYAVFPGKQVWYLLLPLFDTLVGIGPHLNTYRWL